MARAEMWRYGVGTQRVALKTKRVSMPLDDIMIRWCVKCGILSHARVTWAREAITGFVNKRRSDILSLSMYLLTKFPGHCRPVY